MRKRWKLCVGLAAVVVAAVGAVANHQ